MPSQVKDDERSAKRDPNAVLALAHEVQARHLAIRLGNMQRRENLTEEQLDARVKEIVERRIRTRPDRHRATA